MSLSFTLTDRSQPRWLQFVIQAISVPVVVEVLAFSFLFLGSVVVKPLLAAGELADGALVGGIGFLGGLMLARIAPSLISTGGWIWVPALALFAAGIGSDLWVLPRYYEGSYARVLAMWFYITEGDEGARIVFVTYPVYATVAYSVAMFLGSRKHD
jgi:hypothetical protein